MKNPFSPIFGNLPTYMAGRKSITKMLEEALESSSNHPAAQSILYGVRGSGKTSLLTYLGEYVSCKH